MDETTLRELLGSALAGEPPMGPVAQNALRAGIRRRRRRVLGAAGGVAVVAAVAVVAVIPTAFSQRGGASPGQVTASGLNQQLPAAAAARAQAVRWILREVSRATVVGCDPQVCTVLIKQRFPAGNVLRLGPESKGPSRAGLVVVTPAIQAQFGNRLAAVYAPGIIASFGSGTARIDIRLVFPGGTTGYRAVQQTYQRDRKAADSQLLANSRITVSATAQAQLRSGDIDPRLPMLIADMVQRHPVQIVGFGGSSPGGGSASLLRWVDVASAHLTRAAFLSWMRSLIHAQRAEYSAARIQQVTSSTGQTVLRIEYLAPSPLSQP